MKRLSFLAKRCLALVLALVLVFGLASQASAAVVQKKIYTLLAEEYFSGSSEADVTAAAILSSGALVGDGSQVRVNYPEVSSISLSDGILTAKKVSSQYKSLRWIPYSCTINGTVILFDGETTLEVGDPQGARLDVEYQLVLTNLNSTLLQVPSLLLTEAKGQKSVLNRLCSSDEPYMGYMEKLTYSKMEMMYGILDPSPDNLFANMVVLDSADAAKNSALKTCFREVINEMMGNCYTGDSSEAMLTIYDLLTNYASTGLSHYYTNYSAYKSEINAFKGYLDDLLKAETCDGVYLSEADKESGVKNLIECARKYENLVGVSIPDFAVDFVALRKKITEVDNRLTAPNAMINVSSSNLNKLTALLENGKIASSSNEQPTLRTTLSIQTCAHEYDDDFDAICNLCGMEREISSENDDSGDDSTDSNDPESDNSDASGSIPGTENNGSGDDSANSNDSESDSSDASGSIPGTENDGSGDDSANSNDPESDSSDASGSIPGTENDGSGDDSADSNDPEPDSSDASGSIPGTENDGSGDDSADSNDPESDSSDASGSIPGNSNSDYDDVYTTNMVYTTSQFQNYASNAVDGDVVTLSATITLQSDVSVSNAISIVNASKLVNNGYALSLTDTEAGITADGALNVVSAVDGYIPVKAKNSYTYTLTEVSAPKTGGEVAGSKTEFCNQARYLFLDLDPSKGMSLDEFCSNTDFAQLSNYTVTLSIVGNDGSKLIKTADRLVVTAKTSEGKQVAQITYIIIVMGDTNCNGKVNTSDATITKNISMGKEYSTEVMLASDVNFSGTLDAPKINSSDVSYMMAKWFAWDLNKYVSNMK